MFAAAVDRVGVDYSVCITTTVLELYWGEILRVERISVPQHLLYSLQLASEQTRVDCVWSFETIVLFLPKEY
jgi:hypothetical protein